MLSVDECGGFGFLATHYWYPVRFAMVCPDMEVS